LATGIFGSADLKIEFPMPEDHEKYTAAIPIPTKKTAVEPAKILRQLRH
jgi:hypothetical protein